MKKFMKSFALLAVAALGLSACNDDKLVPDNGNADGKFVTVHFGAEASIEGATKATLTTTDELTFKSAWENGDVLSVEYSNDNETVNAITSGVISATWTTDHFEANLPEYRGVWFYDALYPAPNAEKKVDFGSARTQNGSDYNSKYDLMKGGAIAENADAGMTADGKKIVFEMTRQTAIAYFHLTSALDEEVVSAKLSVEGNGAYLSTSDVQIGKDNKGNTSYAQGYAFTETEGVASKEISLTFTGIVPKTSDFKLWFNVLPTIYDKMTLTVETANHTLTISRNATGMYEAGKLYKVVKEIPTDKWVKKGGETPAQTSWIATDLADITATDEVVITMAKDGAVYAMTSDKGTNDNPQAVLVTVKDGELSATPADNLVWNIANDKGNLTIYPNGQKDKWLCAVTGKTDVKVGNSKTNNIFTLDAKTKYLKNTGANRYLGVSVDKADWRAYANTSTNIAGQTLCFYVKGTPKTALETPANLAVNAAKVVSWDAVSGAASYEITIGTKVFTSETNSYDATAVVDDYYDVAVVAIPSDKENYKNSAAATLSGAKFGTPKLTTPELTEGAIDESSIRVNMAVDARATNGCTCEIYNGETLVESKTIKVSYVVFSGLEGGVTYTIKVNAIAVEGEKPYAASDVASIELTTKAAQHVSDVTEAGTYTIKGLTVYAVPNPSNAIVGDGTGFILLYNKSSHGLKVGDTFNVAGTVKDFNGVWEFENPSITGKAAGETPVYPEAVEADEAYLTSYGTATKIEYVHAKGIQSGKNIKVGAKTLYLSAENAETDGKNVEVTGFVYGYNTEFSSASFVATSIQLDSSIPYLSVDQASKVWAADATDAFVVKVTVNAKADWTVTPESLPWAAIAVDKTAGTITVTPNGANTAVTANEATLTVTHASEATLKAEISLKQNGKGTKTYTLQFGTPHNTSDAKIGSYSKSWDATRDGFTWTLANWNNYNNGWNYVKAGSKNAASVATITTNTTMPEAISTVTMTIDAITATYVNSIKLEVLSADEKTVKETINAYKLVKGDCVFNITNPQKDCKYKIIVDCIKGSGNGFVQVSKVVYTN